MTKNRSKVVPEVAWVCPSNIALVKYWGKHENQIPINPSLSFTLKNSMSKTSVELLPKEDQKVFFEFEGRGSNFSNRIENYLQMLALENTWMKNFSFRIKSENTFPHSAGIASSASAFGALALCLADIGRSYATNEYDLLQQASEWARMGSGSACRSVYGGFALWGRTPLFESGSNEFAIEISNKIHPTFNSLKDAILLVDSSPKEVSSSGGHALMESHTYRKSRVAQVHENLTALYLALLSGDVHQLMDTVEDEALSLHAMMMTSKPSYLLLKAGSIEIINRIRQFRNNRNIPVFFTIDAGPNIHLLYFLENKPEVETFIERELLQFCENRRWIDDGIGNGPVKLK